MRYLNYVDTQLNKVRATKTSHYIFANIYHSRPNDMLVMDISTIFSNIKKSKFYTYSKEPFREINDAILADMYTRESTLFYPLIVQQLTTFLL